MRQAARCGVADRGPRGGHPAGAVRRRRCPTDMPAPISSGNFRDPEPLPYAALEPVPRRAHVPQPGAGRSDSSTLVRSARVSADPLSCRPDQPARIPAGLRQSGSQADNVTPACQHREGSSAVTKAGRSRGGHRQGRVVGHRRRGGSGFRRPAYRRAAGLEHPVQPTRRVARAARWHVRRGESHPVAERRCRWRRCRWCGRLPIGWRSTGLPGHHRPRPATPTWSWLATASESVLVRCRWLASRGSQHEGIACPPLWAPH